MKIRSTVVVAVTAATVLAALSGCASGSTTGASSTTSAAPKTTAAARTYTAADLETVLTSAEKSLGVSDGKILTNDEFQAELAQAGTGSAAITKAFGSNKVTFSPATCATELDDALSVKPPTGTIGSALTFGSSVVSVASVSGQALPTSTYSDSTAKEQKLLSDCSTITLSVTPTGSTQSLDIAMKLKQATASTDADKTVALDEEVTLPAAAGGASESVTTISALEGNLLISATSSGTTNGATTAPSGPSLTDAIDAVVAASKK